MKPRRSAGLDAWLRCFAVQSAWNYRTLVGSGIAYAMLPLLARIYAGDPVGYREAVRRHARNFNCHPYLCGMAVTALARLEFENTDHERIERFRTALRGPLGTVGDRLVWAAWRPFCALLALAAWGLGLGPWKTVVLFLVLYNVGHIGLRTWAFRSGWRAGINVGLVLTAAPLDRWARALSPMVVVLAGSVVALVGLRLPEIGGSEWIAAPAAVSFGLAAYGSPSRVGRAAVALLLATPVVWFAFQF